MGDWGKLGKVNWGKPDVAPSLSFEVMDCGSLRLQGQWDGSEHRSHAQAYIRLCTQLIFYPLTPILPLPLLLFFLLTHFIPFYSFPFLSLLSLSISPVYFFSFLFFSLPSLSFCRSFHFFPNFFSLPSHSFPFSQ